jgi:hypothetical protein
MNIVHHSNAKRFIASFGIAAAAAVTPALFLAGAGTAHADDSCYGDLAYSYYCSPGASQSSPLPANPFTAPAPAGLWPSLPGCTGGVIEAFDGEC